MMITWHAVIPMKRRGYGSWRGETDAGTVRIRRRACGNLGIRWVVTFPDGREYRAENADAGKAYAEDHMKREAAS